MSEEFKIEIVNPEKSFLVKEDILEGVVPAFEGEMGILKDHISIISFLKPGIIKVLSKSGTTTSEISSLTKKDFSGFTISTLNSSLIKQQLP
jgi:F0F1-type ATP synthase epsilon subunit